MQRSLFYTVHARVGATLGRWVRKSCSFWADSFDHMTSHVAHRDVTFLAGARASLAKLQAFKQRMGWSFEFGVSGASVPSASSANVVGREVDSISVAAGAEQVSARPH